MCDPLANTRRHIDVRLISNSHRLQHKREGVTDECYNTWRPYCDILLGEGGLEKLKQNETPCGGNSPYHRQQQTIKQHRVFWTSRSSGNSPCLWAYVGVLAQTHRVIFQMIWIFSIASKKLKSRLVSSSHGTISLSLSTEIKIGTRKSTT